MPRKVLDVGQCDLDNSLITDLLEKHFSAEVVQARTIPDAKRLIAAGEFDLVLVNRIIDADGTPGLDLIRFLKAGAQTNELPVMLISNFTDAQQEAVAVGANPGFGKSALHAPATIERLAGFLT